MINKPPNRIINYDKLEVLEKSKFSEVNTLDGEDDKSVNITDRNTKIVSLANTRPKSRELSIIPFNQDLVTENFCGSNQNF